MFDQAFIQDTLTPILAIVGAFFGLLGTGIGLFNFYLNWKSHRVQVTLSWDSSRQQPTRTADAYVSYHTTLVVINKSHFPISVREAGFIMKDSLFTRPRPLPCYGTTQTRIDARDAFSFGTIVGPARVEKDGWASRFSTTDDIKGAIKVYAVLVDGRRIIARCGVKAGVKSLRQDVDNFEAARPAST